MLLGSTMTPGSLQTQLIKVNEPPEETFLFITSEGHVFNTVNSEPLQVRPNE